MLHSDYTVGCDAHKHFSLFTVLDERGELVLRTRVGHVSGAIHAFLSQFPEGTPVALETVGNWYWIVDEIEEAGCIPLLAHAAKAKVMMGNVHKTDKLDAHGLATLLYLGKLPSVWIPPAEVRDERELPRTRMTFAQHRTRVKNRIRSTLAKYALSLDTASDIFAPKWRPDLEAALQRLPKETNRCVAQQLQLLDALSDHIRQLEDRIVERIRTTPTMQLIQTVPGPAKILAIVIDREVGSIDRFQAPKHFTSYCGLVPKLSASAGRAHYGRMVTPSRCPAGKQCNTYLKWAFREAPRSAAEWASKLPTSSSVTAITPIGERNTSSISTSAPAGAKAMPSPSGPPLATWRRPPIGCSQSVNPTGSRPTGLRQGRSPLSRSARDRSAPNKVPRSWRYGSAEIREMIGPPLANVLMPL
jgi:transposase